ncbi:hypothetical protein ACFW82_21525, partial [Streptomyces sp. NPDC058728]
MRSMRATATARTFLIATIAVVGLTVTPALASAQPGTGSARTHNAAGAPGSNGANGVGILGGLGGLGGGRRSGNPAR